jgi:hypothetical protein
MGSLHSVGWIFLGIVVCVALTSASCAVLNGVSTQSPTVTLTVAPTTPITLGQSVTLTWSSTNATTCTASSTPAESDWTGAKTTSGSQSATPGATGTETYTLTCSGAGGNAMASVSVPVNGPAAPTVTLTVAPTTPITLGQSMTLTWSSTNATTCTASSTPAESDWDGAKSTSGTQSATPGATGTQTYTLTCSGAGGSVSASVSVAVNSTSGGPTISSIVPQSIYLDSVQQGTSTNVQINGSGFLPGCTLRDSLFGDTTLPSGSNPNQIVLNLSFDTAHYSPGWITFSVSCLAGTSNSANVAFVGNQNTLALSASGGLYQLDQAQGAPTGQNGFVRVFNSSGTATGSFSVGAPTNGITFADGAGWVLVSYSGGPVEMYDPTVGSQPVNLAGITPGPSIGVATTGNFGCATEPAAPGNLACFDVLINLFNPPFNIAAAGNEPWSLSMVTLTTGSGTESDALVYSRESTELRRYGITEMVPDRPTMTLVKSLSLTGITPEDQLAGSPNGGWQVVTFGSGVMAGKAAFLSQYDRTLVLVDLNTMTEQGRVTLPGIPFRIAADATHGTVIVAFANVTAGLTRFAKVDVATATVSNLNATSSLLVTGLAVSADGSSLFCAMRSGLAVVSNQ